MQVLFFTIFFDAFGHLVKPGPLAEQVIEAESKAVDRPIAIGPHPQIFYFSGKYEIFSVETALEEISASHRPTIGFPGPRGIRVENRIFVTVKFGDRKTCRQAIDHMLPVFHCLGLLVGRPQNLRGLNLRVANEENASAFFRGLLEFASNQKRFWRGR